MVVDAYCVKCKKMITPKDAEIVKTDSGRSRQSGKCPKCGTKTSAFLKG
jgi:RNase P subunit RPR2